MSGIILLAVYAVIMFGVTVLLTKKTDSGTERFHVSNRQMGTISSALSIAAVWIWAPSLFVSGERAFLTGIPGLFWFLVPNVLCLIVFIPFAMRIREQMPYGITLSAYMGEKYNSKKVRGIYQFELAGLSVFSTAVQLLAGAKMISIITGLPFLIITIVLAVIAFSYSQFSGLKASVTTSVFQMLIILAVSVSFLVLSLSKGNGINNLIQGFSGTTGEYGSLFGISGVAVFFGFGLPTAIGLMSGPFGDQSFWQRAFSIKKKSIGKAFAIGALIFAVVPLSLGFIGYIAAGSGFVPNDTGMVNFEFIASSFPTWMIIPFVFMIVSGLLSTVDSNLCSIASLTTDLKKKKSLSKPAMILLLLLGIGIANIPGLTITHLFLFYGTLRASTLLPTVMTLLGKKLTGNGVFYGVLLSLLIGLPIFAYGNIMGDALFKTIGSLTTVLLSGIIAFLTREGVNVDDRKKAEHT